MDTPQSNVLPAAVFRNVCPALRGMASLALALCSLCLTLPLYAQAPGGSGNENTDPDAPPIRAVGPAVPGDNRIFGQVRDRKGRPVAGLLVSLGVLSHSGETMGGDVRTDKQGRFSFANLSYGGTDMVFLTDYCVRISSPEGRYPSLVAADDINLVRGIKTTALAVTVSPGALITGRVYDKRTGKPWAGIGVAAWRTDAGRRSPDRISATKTDTAGRYRLRMMTGAIAISPWLIAGPAGLTRQRKLHEGETVVEDFQANIPPTFVFVDAYRKPIADAAVLLVHYLNSSNPNAHDTFTTNRAGETRAYAIHDGTITARKGDLFAACTVRWDPATGHLFVTTGLKTVEYPSGRIEIPMNAQAPAYVAGSVVDEAGKPVPGAAIELRSQDSDYVDRDQFQLQTDKKGRFHGPLTLDGLYRIRVSVPGFHDQVMQDSKRFTPHLGEAVQVGTIVLHHKLD